MEAHRQRFLSQIREGFDRTAFIIVLAVATFSPLSVGIVRWLVERSEAHAIATNYGQVGLPTRTLLAIPYEGYKLAILPVVLLLGIIAVIEKRSSPAPGAIPFLPVTFRCAVAIALLLNNIALVLFLLHYGFDRWFLIPPGL